MKKRVLWWLALALCFGALHTSLAEKDLTHARIGAMVNSVGEIYIGQNLPEASFVGYASILDAMADLDAGKLDAVVTADLMANRYVLEDPSLEVGQEKLTQDLVSIAVDLGNNALLDPINDLIKQYEEDGTMADMMTRWLDTIPAVPVEIPLADGPVLRVGLAATQKPFSYMEEDGSIVGLAPELAYRIGQSLNRKIEFTLIDFPDLLPALKTGEIDVVVDWMFYTEERAKTIAFSTPYYRSSQVFVMKK